MREYRGVDVIERVFVVEECKGSAVTVDHRKTVVSAGVEKPNIASRLTFATFYFTYYLRSNKYILITHDVAHLHIRHHTTNVRQAGFHSFFAITSPLFRSTFSIIHERINLTLVCRVLIIRFVIGCLELSRNDSILGRIHLILLFDAVSQSFSKQIWIVLIETKYPSFRNFYFIFERIKHFVNHFWF